MRPAEPQVCLTLIPYDKREGLTIKEAADIAGKSPRTINNLCHRHGIGRRVAGGTFVVSKVALAMFLDGDNIALAAYQAGDRTSPLVVSYFERFGIVISQKPARSQSLQSLPSLQPLQP
jgi:hypothetical protein